MFFVHVNKPNHFDLAVAKQELKQEEVCTVVVSSYSIKLRLTCNLFVPFYVCQQLEKSSDRLVIHLSSYKYFKRFCSE